MNEGPEISNARHFESADEMFEFYKTKGERYRQIWEHQVLSTAKEVSDYLDPHGGIGLYTSANSMHSILGFVHPFCTFAGRRTSIEGSRNSKLIKVFDQYEETTEKEKEFEAMPENVQDVVKNFRNHQRDPAHIALAWQGQLSGNQFAKLNHVAIWTHPDTEEGFGYGLYSLYEKIFGVVTKEASPEISTLKLYLSLGFRPTALCNPINGEVLKNIDPVQGVFDRINSGQKTSPFVVQLQRQKI